MRSSAELSAQSLHVHWYGRFNFRINAEVFCSYIQDVSGHQPCYLIGLKSVNESHADPGYDANSLPADEMPHTSQQEVAGVGGEDNFNVQAPLSLGADLVHDSSVHVSQ